MLRCAGRSARVDAAQHYQGMMFHDAMKVGHYELLIARDRYRANVGERGMNRWGRAAALTQARLVRVNWRKLCAVASTQRAYIVL